jgi:hypothetical protein
VPTSHKGEGKGKVVKVIGLLDAGGSEVVLRGGKSLMDILWSIECSDGRYELADFHGRRIHVQGRMGDGLKREGPPLVVVERIEILN